MTSRRAALWINPLTIAGLGIIGWASFGASGAPPGGAAAAGTHGDHSAATKAEATAAKPGTPSAGDKGERKTITGEVMDPACFLEAGPKSIGPGHFQCAVDCARSGQTLAIYDREHDRIYFIAGELPGKNPNDPLMPYIHKKVDVNGVVFHRADAWGIVISRVALHKEGAASSATTSPSAGNASSGAPKSGGQ